MHLENFALPETPAHIALAEHRDYADLDLFTQVITMFGEIATLPPIASYKIDRESSHGSIRWSPIYFFFQLDTEKATRSVLSPAQLDIWLQLTLVDPVEWVGKVCDRDTLGLIVRRCARVYRERKLKPSAYFRPS